MIKLNPEHIFAMPLALKWEFSVSRSKDFLPKCFSIFVPVKANKCCYFFFSEFLRDIALQLVSVVFSQAGSCVTTQKYKRSCPDLIVFRGRGSWHPHCTHKVPTDPWQLSQTWESTSWAGCSSWRTCLSHFPFAEGQAALNAGSGLALQDSSRGYQGLCKFQSLFWHFELPCLCCYACAFFLCLWQRGKGWLEWQRVNSATLF